MGPSILVMGSVEARGPAGPLVLAGTKLQGLTALLALAVPHALSDDRLIDELWGEAPPANPANSLQAQVSQLRRVLGRDVVVRRGQAYGLAVDPDEVDALRFERLLGLAAGATGEGDHRGAAQHYRSALALVRGPILWALLDLPFARDAAGRLDELVLGAHECLADAELASGRHAEVVSALGGLAREHPLREGMAARLIVALYRCGRQVDALRTYAQVRDALAEEFGVEPGPELRALEQAVLAHDPSLDGPAAGGHAGLPGAVDPPAASADRGHSRPEFRQTPGRLPLVGRAHELALLAEDVEDAVAGRGRVAVLVGEPGIGKTRLAEHVAELAEQRGARVGWARGHDGAGTSAFWMWRQVVRTLVERLPGPEVAAALGRGAADLAQVVPEVHDLVPGLGSPAPLDPEASRFRVAEVLTDVLRGLARHRPLVVTLDDVQWADAASLQALAFVAREVTDASILVLVTYRSVGAPADSHLGETLAVLMRQPVVRRVDLTGLDRDALAELAVATGAEPDDALVTTVHRRTQGNPFFAVEVLRLLPDAAADDPRAVVPTGVREAVRQRLRLLPPDCATLLGVASVLGQEFDVATLADVTGTSGLDVLERLEPALDAGIVLAPESLAALRFSHGLVNETVYGDLGVAAKARAHARAAEALGSRHGDAAGAHLLEVATHWARAVPAAPAERAVRSALDAARWAEEHLAHDQAEVQLRRAAALVATLPAGRARDVLELQVQDRLSLVQIVTTGYASPEVVAASTRMRELCLAIDDPELLVPALWRLAIHHTIGMQLDLAAELGGQLLALGESGGSPTPTLAGHLALGATLTHRGDIATARTHLDAAAEMVAAGLDAALVGVIAETPRVWSASFSAWNWWLHGDEDRAEEAVAVAVASGEEAKAAYGTTFAVWFSALIATLRRDPAAVSDRCERGIGLAQASGSGMFVPYLLATRGWALAVSGESELGCDELLGAAAALAASSTRMMAPVFPAFHADACLVDGRPADALAAAEEGLRVMDETGERWFEAELHRLRGLALAALATTPATEAVATEAVAALERAAAVASRQGAGGLGRRAADSLAQLSRADVIS